MSYLVFARKWRPLVFEDVVGQEHITQTLQKAIEKDRVAHAYIFTGTRGVGKTTTARILARALNCEQGPTINPCGTCESCKSIINGSSFDVLEIDGASNNSVDDIREMRENINISSMGGRYRIFVIDEVHMLTKSAFNALLKTLEEPPPRVIFIFATTEPHRIPATIHSRCQRYDFRRISAEAICRQLEKICTKDQIGYTHEGLMIVARKADGSMRDALSLLDQVHSYGQDTIGEKEVRAVLGIVDADVYKNVMCAIADHKPQPILQAIQDVLFHGYDLHEFTVGLEEHLRNLLFAKLGQYPESEADTSSDESTQTIKDQADLFSEGLLLRMVELVRKAEHELKWSSYPRFLIESLLLKLVHMRETISLETLMNKLGSPGNRESTSQQGTPPIPPTQGDLKKKA